MHAFHNTQTLKTNQQKDSLGHPSFLDCNVQFAFLKGRQVDIMERQCRPLSNLYLGLKPVAPRSPACLSILYMLLGNVLYCLCFLSLLSDSQSCVPAEVIDDIISALQQDTNSRR